jgi:hypothetical protein
MARGRFGSSILFDVLRTVCGERARWQRTTRYRLRVSLPIATSSIYRKSASSIDDCWMAFDTKQGGRRTRRLHIAQDHVFAWEVQTFQEAWVEKETRESILFSLDNLILICFVGFCADSRCFLVICPGANAASFFVFALKELKGQQQAGR